MDRRRPFATLLKEKKETSLPLGQKGWIYDMDKLKARRARAGKREREGRRRVKEGRKKGRQEGGGAARPGVKGWSREGCS